MRLRYSEEDEAFRAELLAWLDEHPPPTPDERVGRRSSADMAPWARRWQRTLFDGGWLVPGFPPAWGGRNASAVQQMVYFEVFSDREIPRSANPQGLSIVAASLLDHGTAEQIERWALPTLRGELAWCIGMSEPGAGSDLAGLSTRAALDGDQFVVNGQKVWTSGAHHSDGSGCAPRRFLGGPVPPGLRRNDRRRHQRDPAQHHRRAHPGPAPALTSARFCAPSGKDASPRRSAMDPTQSYYTAGDLGERVLDALAGAGHDVDALDPEALGPFEEFHTFGALATDALAELAGISADDRVLDLGSGIGGPARRLARTRGCRVDGIDLTAEFCSVASDLNVRTGLDRLVTIHHGDALHTSFDDGTFDVAWTQHVTMNVEDKAGLYREARRVLRPGARLAFFDIMAGPEKPMHFPVPWADTPDISFLLEPEEVRALVEAAGFEVAAWLDLSQDAIAFFEAMAAGPAPTDTPLGLPLIIPDFPAKAANLVRSFNEDRGRLVRAVATAV